MMYDGRFGRVYSTKVSQPGIARISDHPPQGSHIGFFDKGHGNSWGGCDGNCPQCGSRGMPGYGYSDKPCKLSIWLLKHDGCTYSPDHGWSRPAKHPVRRSSVQYQRYWPSKPYGQSGSTVRGGSRYPSVYMPSDTTQLGYYYQHVPTWRPNPAMLPAQPWPSTWHRRECPMSPVVGGRHRVSPKADSNSPSDAPPTPPAPPAPGKADKTADGRNSEPVF